MYKECLADVSMIRVILGDGKNDDNIYRCKVIQYIPEMECIYLLVESAKLPAFSLDALYECGIRRENEILKCQGFITERYVGKQGNVICFRIQNGFYKNTVNKI